MAQSNKGKGNDISGSSSGGQGQNNGSGKSIQSEHTCDPSCKDIYVCIFRVPYPIRSFNEKAYAPSIVSLGPYGKGSTYTMDKHKCEAVFRTAQRIKENADLWMEKIQQSDTEIGEEEKNWVDILKKEFQKSDKEEINWADFLMKVIQKSDKTIRSQYEEEIHWDGLTLSRMMTHDACFILEFFKCARTERNQNERGRSMFVFQNQCYKNSMHSAIFTDIMKLENQVPLFILRKILKLEFPHKDEITELAAILSNSNLFKGFPFHPSSTPAEANLDKLKGHILNGGCHLLDLYKMVIEDLLTTSSRESNNASRHGYAELPDSPVDTSSISKAKMGTPCAEKLKKTGIEFKSGEINFEKSKFGITTLSLPPITMKYRTETLLRNLMAYEECQRCSLEPKKTVISNYVHLLDSLIDSEKDVSVLRDSEVIRSFVGSDEVVVRMFNNLGIGITVENPDGDIALTINHCGSINGSTDKYKDVMIQARDHYNRIWNKWIGQLREEYCPNPWYVISLLAATALLVMTLIQTVYAVK